MTDLPTQPHTAMPQLSDELIRRTRGTGMIFSDSRRFPRVLTQSECVVYSHGSYAPSGHPPQSQDVLLRDMSRGGMRFLHGSQLFPGEICSIKLPAGQILKIEVVWCRRIAPGTFTAGCSFVVGQA